MRARFWIAITLLLTLYAARLTHTARVSSPTIDEPLHIAGGAFQVLTGEYGVPEVEWIHPPLARYLEAWPAVKYIERQLGRPLSADITDDWLFRTGVDPQQVIIRGRIYPCVISCIMVLVAAVTARRLYGSGAALVVTLLFVACPNLAAHGSLATTDAPGVATGFIAVVAVCWALDRPTISRGALAGLTLGSALMSKYTVLLLVPLLGCVFLYRLARPLAGSRTRLLAAATACLLATYFVVWASFGFRSQPVERYGHIRRSWGWVTPPHADAAVKILRRLNVVPDDVLYGVLAARARSLQGNWAYFFGEFRQRGWMLFFPVSIATKTPLPALMLVAAGLVALVRRRPRLLEGTSVVAGSVIVVSGVLGPLNLGLRHVLGAYPFFYLLAGAGVAPILERRGGKAVTVGLLATLAWTSVRVHPHELTYFNALGGGLMSGHELFVGSNYDWGQGLPTLAAWIQQRGIDEPVWVAYLGMHPAAPFNYGIRWHTLGPTRRHGPEAAAPDPRGDVWIAASTDALEYNADGAFQFFWSMEPEGRPGYSWYVTRAGGQPRHLVGLAATVRFYGSAAEAFDLDAEALRLDPGNARAAFGLGLDTQKDGCDDDALRWFEHAVELSPSWAAPHAELARMLSAAGDHERAWLQLEIATGVAPDEYEGWITAGELGPAAGRTAEAMQALMQAERLAGDGRDSRRLNRVAYAYLSLGARWHAARASRAALALRAGDTDLGERQALARVLEGAELWTEAAWVRAEIDKGVW